MSHFTTRTAPFSTVPKSPFNAGTPYAQRNHAYIDTPKSYWEATAVRNGRKKAVK